MIDNTQPGGVEVFAGDIIAAANQAATANPTLDVSDIIAKANQIIGLVDNIVDEQQDLLTAVPAGQNQEIRSSLKNIRVFANQQIQLAKSIREQAKDLLEQDISYNVRIQFQEELSGNIFPLSSTGLFGVYAQNTATGEYFYPAQGNNPDELIGLPGGTYVFGAFDGYFDGAGTSTVTLGQATVDNDGFIVITLSYWSE